MNVGDLVKNIGGNDGFFDSVGLIIETRSDNAVLVYWGHRPLSWVTVLCALRVLNED